MTATSEAFVRHTRITPPRTPGGEVPISAPPEVPRAVPPNLLVRLLPAVMIVAVVGMVALMAVTGGRQMMSNPLFLMFPLMMLMSMVGMFASGGRSGNKRAAELNEERKDYFRYLGQLRNQVRDTAAEQREALEWSHPDPGGTLELVGTRRMWERRAGDADFAHVRVGGGSQRLATRLLPPETGPLEDLEPVSMVALRRFVRTHSRVHRLPTAISLRGFPAIVVEGIRQETRELMRAMVVSLAVAHAPDQLRIAVVTGDPLGEAWDWAKWLPHVGHPSAVDGLGPVRMIYSSLADLESSLAGDLADRGRFTRSAPSTPGRPFLVIVVDDGYVSGDERLSDDAGMDGVALIDLTARPTGLARRRGLRLLVNDRRIAARSGAGIEEFAEMDGLSVPEAEAISRRLARYRLATVAALASLESEVTATDPGLPALLGIADATRFDPVTRWGRRTDAQRLRVPVGYLPDGSAVDLDIKESAHGGMGPHGLCVGATGSGKSEFLRTLVLAMVANHSPAELNLVLVDFKGGATFLGLDTIPHTAAVITNLEQELAMVDRMKDALSGELHRRQELLRAAGNFANVGEYERARRGGADLAPLPALFIVVDEFSELLAQKPDFAELFVAIGRLGRSLHIHLLLASQRLEEGKLRGLDSHLSYRIGLKTFSANESRSVLGVPDAYHLPNVPGSAYLKCDSGDPIRFNTSYVSGPYHPPVADALYGASPSSTAAGSGVRMKVFNALPVPLDTPPAPSLLDRAAELLDEEPEPSAATVAVPTLLETIVGRVSGYGPRAHEVWLPPLDASPTVDQLFTGSPAVPLKIPLAVVDRPYDQRRDVLTLDLAGGAGNVAIVGAPQSGKSTAIRTLILSAAAQHTPEQLQFYCLDFGGGGLAALARLPHVGSVASRGDMDAVRRTVAEVTALVRAREQLFAEHGIESMRDYRARRAQWMATGVVDDDPLAADRHGDVFLVLDGIAVLRNELDALEEQITAIVGQGLSFGVHVVVTAARWAEIRPGIKDLIGTRVELRLGDPLDSEMGRRSASLVPAGQPGRGLTAEELHLLVAVPRLDGESSTATQGTGLAAAVAEIGARFPGREAMAVRRLGTEVRYEDVVASASESGIELGPNRVAIGLGESELAPVILDFTRQPHLLTFGDIEHGKSTLLRTLIRGVVSGATPDEVKIVLIDYRRTLLGVVAEEYLAGYASAHTTAAPMMAQLAEYFRHRLPPEDVTPQQLRERSWWSGPEVYVVIDDHDMVSTSSSNPLLPLIELAASARDIGMHIVLARRSGGAGRALYEPLINCLRELSSDVLLMSGDRDEGFIVGRTRMQKLVPGRAELISRHRRQEMIQIAVTTESE